MLHPAIDLSSNPALPWPARPAPLTLVSLNRYERKKDLALAIRALEQLREGGGDARRLRLVLAGGWDPRLRENVEYFEELEELVREE